MKRKYRGILATGATKAEATSNFRDLVFGKGASMLVDENGGNAFVAKASDAEAMFNPRTGDMDLASRDGLLQNVRFVSQSSVDENSQQEAFHAHCSHGCGSHIIASSESLLKFCPLCTASLSSGNGEEDGEFGGTGFAGLASDDTVSGDGDSDDTGSENSEDNSDDADQLAQLDAEESTSSSVVRRSIRRVRRRLSAKASGDEGSDDTADGSDDTPASDDVVPDVVSDDSADVVSDDADSADGEESNSSEPLVVVAADASEAVSLFREHKSADLVSTSSEIPADMDLNFYSCSSAEGCGHVVLAEVPVHECPNCKARLNEPTAVESAEFQAAASDDGEDDEASATSEDDSDDSLPVDDPVDGLGDDTDEGEPQETSEASDDDIGVVSDDDAENSDDDDGTEISDDDDAEQSTSAVVLPDRRMSVSGEDDGEVVSDDGDDEESGDTSLGLTSDDGSKLDAGSDDGEEADDNSASDDAEIAVMADATDVVSDLSVSYSASIQGQSAWTAYVKNKPVAMAFRADCSDENKDIFDSQRFGQAVMATATVSGVRAALEELQFRPIRYAFSSSSSIRAAVEAGVAKKMEAISAAQEEFEERFEAALASAAIGINRGFFKDDVSPLKEALCSTMRACGTHAPERMIDRVFSESHDSYLQMLFARAKDIMSKPAEVQESLSKTILDTGYQAMQSESSERTGLEPRLENIGSPVAQASDDTKPERPEVSTSAGTGDWKEKSKLVVSGLGRRR